MAVRWKKYHKECKGKRAEGDRCGKVVTKGIDCKGKRGSHCPSGVSLPCGAWTIEFFNDDGEWVSRVVANINSEAEARKFLSEIVNARQQRKLSNMKRALVRKNAHKNKSSITSKKEKLNSFCKLELLPDNIPDNIPEILTPEEAAAFLRVKKSTIYQWTMKDLLPTVKLGSLNRYRKTDLLNFVEQNTHNVAQAQ